MQPTDLEAAAPPPTPERRAKAKATGVAVFGTFTECYDSVDGYVAAALVTDFPK